MKKSSQKLFQMVSTRIIVTTEYKNGKIMSVYVVIVKNLFISLKIVYLHKSVRNVLMTILLINVINLMNANVLTVMVITLVTVKTVQFFNKKKLEFNPRWNEVVKGKIDRAKTLNDQKLNLKYRLNNLQKPQNVNSNVI